MHKGIIVHVAFINNNKLLILKRAKGVFLEGRWDLPGGTLEDGEIPENGVVREALEESGLKLKNPKLFYCYSNIDRKKKKQFFTLIFLAKTDKKNIKVNPKEHSEYAWVNLNQLRSYKTAAYLKLCVKELKLRIN